jgi:hypothetical protein
MKCPTRTHIDNDPAAVQICDMTLNESSKALYTNEQMCYYNTQVLHANFEEPQAEGRATASVEPHEGEEPCFSGWMNYRLVACIF